MNEKERNGVGVSIAIIRHGQTDWNREGRLQGIYNIPLNKEGIKQIRRLAGQMNGVKWDQIVTSPLKRAHESAIILAEELKIEDVKIDSRLQERDFGSATGKILKVPEKGMNFAHYTMVESWDILQKRMIDCIWEWTSQTQYENILFVSHGTAIKALLEYIDPNLDEDIKNGKIIQIDKMVNSYR